MMHAIPRSAIAAATAALLSTSGCMVKHNERTYISDDVRMQAIHGPTYSTLVDMDELPVPALTSERPRPVAIDRSAWAHTHVRIPIDTTHHRPLYYTRIPGPEESWRQRGIFPTSERALETEHGSLTGQIEQAALSPFFVAYDTIAFLPRLILNPPWTEEHSPELAYERVRRRDWLRLPDDGPAFRPELPPLPEKPGTEEPEETESPENERTEQHTENESRTNGVTSG